MGSALSTFNDFMNNTGPAFLTSASDIVNEAVKNNYMLRRFMRGKGPSETIQGGSTIKDTILFDEQNTFQFYQPNETFSWQNPQILEQWEINWRFAVDHMSWTDHEIELNVGGLGRNARHQTYKEIKRSKEQRLWTSWFNGMEDHLFAAPSNAEMEAQAGTQPYSLPCFISEVAPTTGKTGIFDGGTGGLEWSTLQGLQDTKWDNQRATYTPDATAANQTYANVGEVLFSAFDEMYQEVQFIPPPSHQEYFENPSLNAMMIATSKGGYQLFQGALRASQDTFVTASRQDPSYMKPQYAGIDVEWNSSLDDLAVYKENGAANYNQTEKTADIEGPRYYFINANYLKFVFHTTRYMYTHPTMKHPNQPFTTVMPVDCWYNMICRSRHRQGIVSPATNDVAIGGY